MKLFLILIASFCFSAFAAPHPATSTSFLIGQKNGRFISQHGFMVNGAETGWVHRTTPAGVENIETMYSSPVSQNGVEASLTVRVEEIEKDSTLNTHMKQWLKDYHRFGFDVLASQKVKLGENQAQMLDLVHNSSSKQIRQILFTKNNRVVVFTCRDNKQTFLESLKKCNEIVRSFRWTI